MNMVKNLVGPIRRNVRKVTLLFLSALFMFFASPPAISAESSTTVFLWSDKYPSKLAECPIAYSYISFADSYDAVSIDSQPNINAPTDVLTITVEFNQDCYDPNGLKYQRTLSMLTPNGDVVSLTRDPKLSRSRERTYSIYCYLVTGGCWGHSDVYQVRIGSSAPSGDYGLRFETSYLETVCSSVDGASVCEKNVPQSSSFDLPKLFTISQTGIPAPWESGEEITGEMLLQRAGSQVFLTSEDMEGSFQILEDGVVISEFEFNTATKAFVVEQRLTGNLEVKKLVNGKAIDVAYRETKGLLWFENINLGTYQEDRLSDEAWVKVSRLADNRFLYSGVWLERETKVTKFICTGIYREGATAAEKLVARKRAKLACEIGKAEATSNNSNISFFYQTKATKAASYVGKVLVTVKGVEPFVASRLK